MWNKRENKAFGGPDEDCHFYQKLEIKRSDRAIQKADNPRRNSKETIERIQKYKRIKNKVRTSIHSQALETLREHFCTNKMKREGPLFEITSNHCSGFLYNIDTTPDQRNRYGLLRTNVQISISLNIAVEVYPLEENVYLVHLYGLERVGWDSTVFVEDNTGFLERSKDWEEIQRGLYGKVQDQDDYWRISVFDRNLVETESLSHRVAEKLIREYENMKEN